MDIFLIKDGIIENAVVLTSLEQARRLYPEHTCVERTETNAYNADGEPLNIGDLAS